MVARDVPMRRACPDVFRWLRDVAVGDLARDHLAEARANEAVQMVRQVGVILPAQSPLNDDARLGLPAMFLFFADPRDVIDDLAQCPARPRASQLIRPPRCLRDVLAIGS
jgi:hypothetical protein